MDFFVSKILDGRFISILSVCVMKKPDTLYMEILDRGSSRVAIICSIVDLSVSASSVQQAIDVHEFSQIFPTIGYYKILNRVPCAEETTSIVHLFLYSSE